MRRTNYGHELRELGFEVRVFETVDRYMGEKLCNRCLGSLRVNGLIIGESDSETAEDAKDQLEQVAVRWGSSLDRLRSKTKARAK
jgi:hypothetical protein